MKEKRETSKKTLSRREMLRLMGGSAGMLALAGCVPVATQPAPQQQAAPAEAAATEAPAEAAAEPAQAATTMTILHRREYFKEMEDIFRNNVLSWAGENNVDAEVSTVGAEAFEDFVAKLVASVEAGDPPDLVYHVRLVQQLLFLDALEPVSDAVERAIEMYGEVPELNKQLNFVEDTWWGIPFSVHGGGQFARRDLFEAAGIDPDSMETYDLRRDGALAVSNPDEEIYGWGLTVNRSGDGSGFIANVIHNWGGSVTNAEMTELIFNSPETVAAVEWLTEVYTAEQWAPMLPPGVISWTDSSNNEAYLAGNIAYTHNAASVYAQSKAEGNPVYENTIVLEDAMGPLGERLSGSSGGQFIVAKGAANPELAKELALYLINPDVFLPMSTISAGLFLPTYAGYYEMEAVMAEFEADPNLARMGESALGSYPGLPYPAKPNPYFDAIDAQTILTDMMAQTITQGVSPADAVQQAHDRMAQIADEMQVFGG